MHPLHANIDFSQFTDDAFSTAAHKVLNQLTTNAVDFPGLPVTMLIFGGHLATYDTVLGKPIYPNKTGDLKAARDLTEGDLRKNGVTVNTISNGVLSMLEKSGYPISKEHAPVGPLAQAKFKSISSIANGFDIKLEPIPHAEAYIVCVMPTANVTGNNYTKWPWYNTSSTSLKITDLDSGVKYTLVVVATFSVPEVHATQ
jgi:hypothetical protein